MQEIEICGKKYPMSASVLTIANFKNIFGMEADYGETYGNILKALDKLKNSYTNVNGKLVVNEGENVYAYTSQLIENATKMAYVLIKEENSTFMSYEEWARTLTNMTNSRLEWVNGVIGIAKTVF